MKHNTTKNDTATRQAKNGDSKATQEKKKARRGTLVTPTRSPTAEQETRPTRSAPYARALPFRPAGKAPER